MNITTRILTSAAGGMTAGSAGIAYAKRQDQPAPARALALVGGISAGATGAAATTLGVFSTTLVGLEKVSGVSPLLPGIHPTVSAKAGIATLALGVAGMVAGAAAVNEIP